METSPHRNIENLIGYINNTVKKLPIYFNSDMRIDEEIVNIIPKLIHVFTQDSGAYKHKNCFLTNNFFCGKKYLRQPSINFDVCNLSSSVDVIYNERW